LLSLDFFLKEKKRNHLTLTQEVVSSILLQFGIGLCCWLLQFPWRRRFELITKPVNRRVEEFEPRSFLALLQIVYDLPS
jgi:hypothetical protein